MGGKIRDSPKGMLIPVSDAPPVKDGTEVELQWMVKGSTLEWELWIADAKVRADSVEIDTSVAVVPGYRACRCHKFDVV